MIFVTPHACQRYTERVRQCSFEDAKAHILGASRAIEAAAAFGCEIVRMGGGERLVLDGSTVVTVYAPHTLPRQLRRNHSPIAEGEWL